MPTTRVLAVDPDRPDPRIIAEAAKILRAGGLIAFATETVYGLGADATNPEAVARIFEAKGRPATNPLIVHVAGKDDAKTCVSEWPDRADRLADVFWPGPLTLVLPRSPIIPDVVTAGQDTIGVRVPRPDSARWLILESGRPIAAPSANRSNGISPTMAAHVLKDLDGRIDLILDGGRTRVGVESTVLDLTTAVPRVLRPGHITREQIARVLGGPVEPPDGPTGPDGPARSPGQLAVHYAPKTPTYRVERGDRSPARWDGVSQYHVVVVGDYPRQWPPAIEHSGPSKRTKLGTPDEAEGFLYAVLHSLDGRGLDSILILPPPDKPQWRAIRDRIWRATRPWPAG